MSRKAFSLEKWMPLLVDTAYQAGAVIMPYYKTAHIVDRKDDASPVTEADRAADRLIVARLNELDYTFPVVSEEGEQPDVSGADCFWLVDPLDGTRSFIRGNGYFTVNIALVEHGTPIAGVVYDPVNDAMYWGSFLGAFRSNAKAPAVPICTVSKPRGEEIAVVSHRHKDLIALDYLARRGVKESLPCASSFKFCLLAEGNAQLYPRFGPTMEWDTAAGHALLLAAGGSLTAMDGTVFHYGKKGFLNGDFIAEAESSEN